MFQEGSINIKDLLFLQYKDRGEGHATMASHEMEIERDEQKALKGELDQERMA